jgi:hypothetical protein
MIEFQILWLDIAPFRINPHSPAPRIIGRDTVRHKDLSAAIVAASNMLRREKGNSDYARGFVVRAVTTERS